MSLEQALSAVEQQLESISVALLAADPLVLERSSAELRLALGALAQAAAPLRGQAWPQALQPRLQAVSNQLALQRAHLVRLGALVDQQVASFLPPASAAPTYGPKTGGSARIYRSAT